MPVALLQRHPVLCSWESRPLGADRSSLVKVGSARQSSIPIYSIDVEYAHYRRGRTRQYREAAEIAVVDADHQVVFASYCSPGPRLSRAAHCGGVPWTTIIDAPPLAQVQPELERLFAGAVLLGHGLASDLAAVGLRHPLPSCQDTRELACFQSTDGAARSLRKLAELHLDLRIQDGVHSAREDAMAVMRLFLEHGHMSVGCQPRALLAYELHMMFPRT